MEYGVFISHGIWLLRTRDLRRRAKEAQLPFDEFPEAMEWQDGGFKWRPVLQRIKLPHTYRETRTVDNEFGLDTLDQEPGKPSTGATK